MNAKELFDIVGKVDRAAWPECVYDKGCRRWWISDKQRHHEPEVRYMVTLFVGSISQWFMDEDLSITITPCQDKDVGVKVGLGEWHIGKTLIEALAAAQKSVSEVMR